MYRQFGETAKRVFCTALDVVVVAVDGDDDGGGVDGGHDDGGGDDNIFQNAIRLVITTHYNLQYLAPFRISYLSQTLH